MQAAQRYCFTEYLLVANLTMDTRSIHLQPPLFSGLSSQCCSQNVGFQVFIREFLYPESGEPPPLSLRRDYMIYYTRLQRIPGSHTSRLIFNALRDNRSCGKRMRNLMQDLNMKLSKVPAVGTLQFLGPIWLSWHWSK